MMRAATPRFKAPRLLFVFFDDVRRPDSGVIGIFAELPERTALAQEVPALIQLDPDRFKPLVVGLRPRLLTVEPMLFLDEMFDVLAHGSIEVFVGHRQSALTSGTSTTCSERNHTCFSFPRTTSDTRRSFVPSSPAAAAWRAIERASSMMIS